MTQSRRGTGHLRVGGGGQRVFVFEAKRSGSAHLLLKLRREWEGDKSIASRFEVTINVAD